MPEAQPVLKMQSKAQPEEVVTPEKPFIYTTPITNDWKLQYTDDMIVWQDAIELQDYTNSVDDAGTHVHVNATNNMRFYRVVGL